VEMDGVNKKLDEQRKAEEERRKKEEEEEKARLAALEELRAKRREALAEWSANTGSVVNSIGAMHQSLSRVIAAEDAKRGKESKEGLRDQFISQQIFANVMATINGVIALTQAWSSAAPPFNAGAMAAATAGNIAHRVAINAVPVPSFHRGGLQSDEVMIRARAGERTAVLSPQGVANGGVAAVHRANAGISAGSDTVNVFKVGSRVIDVQTHRSLARPDSPLSSAMRATQPRSAGRYNRWAKV
jgi:hypothetical protein